MSVHALARNGTSVVDTSPVAALLTVGKVADTRIKLSSMYVTALQASSLLCRTQLLMFPVLGLVGSSLS